MRLSKLKLMGFKSFVDPTTIHFPSARVGIVGPNGCGKSNTIDAVRWVMGEISAKNLRGGAMTDVIFNGSGTRKAAEQAAIELVFEEVDLPQFPDQAEIAVKREINRKAQSNYYLNNVRCRRKDIMDLFLGTGLGPRSYAIIEQGMISRLIEAKPDELRIFFEEAAGISKYKERRKETEQKMKQTRDNLARLDEVRNELQKQLEKLQRQAREAERFQQLKQSEKLLKAELLAIRWYNLDTVVQDQQQTITDKAQTLEADLLQLHTLEQTNKQQREAQQAAQQQFNSLQAKFYALDGEIKRLQQEIEHGSERNDQLQFDLEQLEEKQHATQKTLDTDRQQLHGLSAAGQDARAAFDLAEENEQQAQAVLQDTEAQLADWQTQWDTFNEAASAPMRKAESARARMQSLEQRIAQNEQRLLKLAELGRNLQLDTLQQQVAALHIENDALQAELATAEQQLDTAQQAVLHQREVVEQLDTEHHQHTAQQHKLSGRLASLEALQEAALGKSNKDLTAWLHAQNLRNTPSVAQSLKVEAGWERAVEVVLGAHLQALCVDDLEQLRGALQKPPLGKLMMLELAATGGMSSPSDSLLSKVHTDLNLQSFLSHVRTVPDVATAYQQRGRLEPHQSLITPEGIWLGRHWLYSQQGEVDEKAGMLAREQDIKALARELSTLDNHVVVLTEKLAQQRDTLHNQEQLREEVQATVTGCRKHSAEIAAQLSGKQARLESLQGQQQRLQEEHAELNEHISADNQTLETTRHELNAALATMEQYAEQREQLSQQRDQYQELVMQARQAWHTAKDERHQLDVKLESLRADYSSLGQAITRLEAQLDAYTEERGELEAALANNNPIADLEMELAEFTEQREGVQESLREAEQTLSHLNDSLSQYDSQRSELESRSGGLRTELEQLRMESQANEVRRQTVEEQLAESEYSPVALLAELPEYADEESWQSQIDAVERKLANIGSVNLAALDEFEEQAKRKEYLDEQGNDLLSALEQLENAIKTIDRETRARFRQTIETVNTNMQELFPRLFGGGEAKLELIGDDVLKAGVAIMARPPGKRNSTIHLLSGGEKALTAIALVFAIFELNPSPFCMLDEVDAPLDDANVGRFCKLVEAMSERVQIIFISHNKIAMEMAQQLVGVTQQEAGVSRLVTVDLDDAVEMVAA